MYMKVTMVGSRRMAGGNGRGQKQANEDVNALLQVGEEETWSRETNMDKANEIVIYFAGGTLTRFFR